MAGASRLPDEPTDESPIDWDRFVEILSAVGAVESEAVTPATTLAELAPTQLDEALLFTAVSKVAFGLERRHFAVAVNLSDLFALVRERRIGTLETPDLRVPPEGAPTKSPVWLRPVRQSDVALLYQAAQSPRSAFRWRLHGALPPPTQQFVDLLHQGVLAQFIVEAKADGSAQGLVAAYDAIHEYGTCCIAFQRIQPSREGGEMFLGMFHLVEYVFSRWNMRKLYADVPGYNLEFIGKGFGPLTEEARLRDFVYFDGRYWDRVWFAIERERWNAWAEIPRAYLQEGLYPDPWR